MNEVLEHLYEDLAEHPHQVLVRVREPELILLYSFTVQAEGDPPHDYIFEFQVRYGADEETLVVTDCNYLSLPSGL
jgi:hypothetical protein